MIRIFHVNNYSQEKVFSLEDAKTLENACWIDLQNPSSEEIREVEKFYNVSFPTKQQQEEIETSSRYLEKPGVVQVNSTFINFIPNVQKLEEREVSFIVTKNILFSLRYYESKVFEETIKKIKTLPTLFSSPEKIFIALFETRIDFDADIIEVISKHIAEIGRKIKYNQNLDEQTIIKINHCQELTMTIREALFDKQRVISLIHRNEDLMEGSHQRLRIVIKDINSLIEHANFNFARLEYLQNSFLGLINLEQNKVIKIFTFASLLFMPPTLIASMYGMNFAKMPELGWNFGYPLALFVMALSSAITIFVFKKKNWL